MGEASVNVRYPISFYTNNRKYLQSNANRNDIYLLDVIFPRNMRKCLLIDLFSLLVILVDAFKLTNVPTGKY